MSEQAVAGPGRDVTAPAVGDQPEPVARALRLANEIHRRREEKNSANIKSKPRTSLWASQIPDCERQGVYEFTHWQEKKLHDWKLETLFRAGRDSETSFKAELRELGIELVEDGAPISDDIRIKYGVNGYLDTRIKWEGKRIPVEMKMMSPMMFEKIREGVAGIEDLKRNVFYRKYIRQGLVYLLGTNEEALMFALTNGRGGWKFLVLHMDYQEAERILKIAESIKGHVAAKTLPDRIDYDPGICGRCAFAHICIPNINSIPAKKIEGSAALAELLERRDAILDKSSEFDKIDKQIKKFFDDVKDGIFTVGNFIIVRKNVPRTSYPLTDAQKLALGVKKDSFRNSIERFAQPDPEGIYMEPKRILSIEDDE